MEKNKGFYVNNGVVIEGYLSDESYFNGILFLLREPNSENQTSFWFKDCLKAEPSDTISKRTRTKYINTFERLLSYAGKDYKLKECAYANVIPYKGERTVSTIYKALDNDTKADRFLSLVNECHPTHAFVCSDMFDALKNCGKLHGNLCGVDYESRGKKRCALYDNSTIKVYEIYHPAAPVPYPKEKNNRFDA